ncbi:phosphotransferase enzyme family protein [Shewanella yunxiaonensis]|uniref:phosphotransferase enzyme family protein n=1 Tax=Shewanella yunxiaonensis TaxID=2829809 RepID=UPI001E4AADE2|nr:aminoglycoside phosphotransferase family protein [Shewanella yunxiaonensis]
MSPAANIKTDRLIREAVLPHYFDEKAISPLVITPLGNGHINGTWLVDDGGSALVLQCINTIVFPQPWQLIANSTVIAQHLADKHDQGSYPLTYTRPLPTRDNHLAVDLGEQGFWRAISYIPDSCSIEQLTNVTQAEQLAQAFGQFVGALADIDAHQLAEVIPGFRSLAGRLQALQQAATADRLQRLRSCHNWYELALSQQSLLKELADIEPLLPLRVCHNDTKINNLLFSQGLQLPVAVVDLDTCMPGYLMYDFGDMVRSCCAAVAEDNTALASVQVLPDYFAALTRGWQRALGQIMTAAERESLWLGVRVVTLMLAVRFLTDYLDGDNYFRVEHPQHNLQRAANQFTLYQRLLAQESELIASLSNL